MTRLTLADRIARGEGIDDLCAAAGNWSPGFRAWARFKIWEHYGEHDTRTAGRNSSVDSGLERLGADEIREAVLGTAVDRRRTGDEQSSYAAPQAETDERHRV